MSLYKFIQTRSKNRVIENRVMENRVKRGITVVCFLKIYVISVSADMKKLISVFYRYRPIRKFIGHFKVIKRLQNSFWGYVG